MAATFLGYSPICPQSVWLCESPYRRPACVAAIFVAYSPRPCSAYMVVFFTWGAKKRWWPLTYLVHWSRVGMNPRLLSYRYTHFVRWWQINASTSATTVRLVNLTLWFFIESFLRGLPTRMRPAELLCLGCWRHQQRSLLLGGEFSFALLQKRYWYHGADLQ